MVKGLSKDVFEYRDFGDALNELVCHEDFARPHNRNWSGVNACILMTRFGVPKDHKYQWEFLTFMLDEAGVRMNLSPVDIRELKEVMQRCEKYLHRWDDPDDPDRILRYLVM